MLVCIHYYCTLFIYWSGYTAVVIIELMPEYMNIVLPVSNHYYLPSRLPVAYFLCQFVVMLTVTLPHLKP